MNRKILMLFFASVAIILLSCGKNKDVEDPHNRDISTLPLSELKTLLNGNWKLVYSWGFYPGRIDYPSTYINFYNFADSIKWTENNVETIRTNATYTKIRNYFSGDSTYQIYHLAIAHNCYYSWSAENIKNDTLVLKDQTSEPTTYYLIK